MNARLRCLLVSSLVLLAGLAGASSAAASTPYVQVPGSPFTGSQVDAWSIAFNRAGTLAATVDELIGGVTIYTVNPATGALTATAGSPYPTGDGPDSVAFGSTSTATYLAVADEFSGGVILYSVSATGALTEIGTPASLSGDPTAVAFNPAGTVLAATSHSGVQTYSVSPTGLTPLESAVGLSANESAVTFSPDGSWLVVTEDEAPGFVWIYPVGASGTITSASSTKTAAGDDPSAAAFSPSGALLAVTNAGGNSISMYSFDQSSGALTALGAAQATGSKPTGVAFNAGGQLLASANYSSQSVSLFAVNAQTGALTAIAGTPYPTGNNSQPNAVAFNPDGLLAVPDFTDDAVHVFAPAAPTAQLSSPLKSGVVYGVGESVPTSFACADSAYGLGIASCTDSNGSHSPGGHLATSSPGIETYSVTALSADGQSSQAVFAYTVAAKPRASISSPKANHTYRLGTRVKTSFSCLDGAFGPGILSCVDSGGSTGPHGSLSTAAFGPQRYTVTAVSDDGLESTASIRYRVAAPPAAAITAPADGAHYELRQTVDARYRCSEGLGGAGIASCRGPVARGKKINTSKPGRHTFRVNARSKDGLQAGQTVTYFVS